MSTSGARCNRFSYRMAPALLAILALAVSAATAPTAAGGLADFFKKGGKASGSQSRPSSSGSSSERDSVSSDRHERGGGIGIWSKPKPRDTSPPADRERPRRGGGLLDIFDKQGRPQPAGSIDEPAPGTDAVRPPANASGGLSEFFQKPGRPQPQRPSAAPVPMVVILHYRDPWYYPYDRFFYDYYCPYVLRERVIWIRPGLYWYYYGAPFEDEDAADALRDIERGWQERNYALIDRHVDEDSRIRIYENGEYSHSLTAREFQALTLQAFDDVSTLRFRFIRSRRIHSREVRAEGEHVFIGPDGGERRVKFVWTLRRQEGRWYVRGIDMLRKERVSYRIPEPPGACPPMPSLAGVPEASTTAACASGAAQETPDLAGPCLAVESSRPDTILDEPGRLLIAAETSALKVSLISRETLLRVVCVSKPIRWEELRAAKAPIAAATLTCTVLRASPLLNLAVGSRQTSDVLLSVTEDGMAWTVRHRGENRALESGTIAADALKIGRGGHVRVMIDRISTPTAGTQSREQRVILFSRERWDYRALLASSPKPPAGKPFKTELIVGNRGS